ncbi:MAG: glycosyltransferase family 39 protein [Endomicrobia bacterium]|nr:glycosyltransferase family 39 protein [Endomicrobiia bacterium]
MKNVVVFTPTYNEAKNIEIFVKQVFDVLPDCKLVVVDDNSPDGTSQVVEQLQKKYKNLYLITRTQNRGRGYAGIVGFKKALELKADIIVEMAADLSHSPYELPKMLYFFEKNSDIDVIIGSRYIKGGIDKERNIFRKLISLFARFYIKIFLGIYIKDVTSGYRLYKRETVEKILPYLRAKDPFIVTEVNYLCKMFGFKFLEVPIEFHDRLYGKSKLTTFKLVRYLAKVMLLPISFFIQDKYNLLFIKILLLTTFLRIWLSGMFGLTDDESHYWQYAQYIDFSYFDHPPLVGYIIYLFTSILGNNLYAVRLPSILCFAISSIYFYRLVKDIFNSKVAFYSSVLLSVIPIIFVGSIVTLPDAPLGMFWMMYMFYFYKFIITKESWYIYLNGLILGLALLSKYNAIFLFISSLLLFITISEIRNYLKSKDFYISYLISIVVFSPVLLWNIAHKYASFNYQLSRGVTTNFHLSLATFFENLIAQSIYISPILFLAIFYSLIYFFIKKVDIKYKYFIYFALPGIIFFNFIGLKSKILPHWPAISYISCIPLVYFIGKKKILYYICIIFSFMLTVFVILVTLFGIIKLPPYLEDKDTPDKLYGWEILAKQLYEKVNTNNIDFIVTHKYFVAGQVRFSISKFYRKDRIPEVFCLDDYLNQYDFWYNNLIKYNGCNAIYVTEGRFPEDEFLKETRGIFRNIKLLEYISYRKNKFWPKRIFKIFICENFNYEIAKSKFFDSKHNNSLKVTQYFRDYDKKIFLKINKNNLSNNKIFRITSYLLTSLGNGFVLIPLVCVFLYFFDKNSFLRNLVVFIIIISTGGLLVHILKSVFDKPRPLKLFFDILNQPINVIGEHLREYGFPSGHTFLAFATYEFLSDRINKKTIKVLLFILALLVGISRILVGAHFLSDVIAGMIIGIVFSSICLKLEKKLS